MNLTPHSSCFSPTPSSYLLQTTLMPMPVAPQSNSQSKLTACLIQFLKMFKQDGTGSNTIAHDDVIIQLVGKGRMDIPCAFWLDWLDFHRRRDVPHAFYCTRTYPVLPLSCSLTGYKKVHQSFGRSVGRCVRWSSFYLYRLS